MADSMCGPSNGAKNLLSHTERDRSLHQDRLVNPQAGPAQTFRNVNNVQARGAEASFNAFQAGVHPVEPMMAMPGIREAHASMAHSIHGRPITTQGIAAARLDSPATGGAGHAWISEFQALNISNSANTNLAFNFNNTGVVHAPSMMQTMRPPTQTEGYRPYLPAMAPPAFQPAAYTPDTTSAGQASKAVADVPQESAETKAAFDDLFSQYDAANQAEYAAQTTEFEKAEGEWMSEHGPAVDAAKAAEAAVVQEMEELAAEQEARKIRMDDELARAAGDILYAVEGNASEKFQNSNFLSLMRRIAAREVVVEEKSFVNAVTGDEINIVMDEGPKGTVFHGNGIDDHDPVEGEHLPAPLGKRPAAN